MAESELTRRYCPSCGEQVSTYSVPRIEVSRSAAALRPALSVEAECLFAA
jgi:hypothetical protein